MHAIAAISLVFGGCCSNVICLELIVTEHPGSVNIITFAQFLFIAMEGFVFSAKFGTKTPAIPLTVHGKLTLLYLISVLFQVMLLYLHVDIPLQQLLRSGTLIANLILGVVLLKRSYRFTKYLSVVMICIGIGVSTLASSYQSSKLEQESDHHYGPKQFFSWLLGIFLLLLALITSGLLGIYQEWMFNKYGKHATESLYYSHLLPLPLFFFLAKDIHRHAQMYSTSEPFLEGLLDIPKMWIYLVINVLSHYACISGVFLLSAECTSLTVNLILTLRKFSSLLFSVIYFDNAFTLFHWIGTILVFGGTLLFVDVGDLFRKQPLLSSGVVSGSVSSSETNHDQNGFIADENEEEFLSVSSSNISNDTTCVKRTGASSSSISNSSANGYLSSNFNSSANVNSLANGAADLKLISATSSESTTSHARSNNLNTVSTTHPDFTSFTSGISNTVSNGDNSNDSVSCDFINIPSTECNNIIESTLESNLCTETGTENILYSSASELNLRQRKVNVSQSNDISHEENLTNTKDSALFGRNRQYVNENISSVRRRDNDKQIEIKDFESDHFENRISDINVTGSKNQDIVIDEQGCTSNNNALKSSTGLGVFDKFKSVFERKETGARSDKIMGASIENSSIKDDSSHPGNFDTTSVNSTQTMSGSVAIKAIKYESGKALINTLENKEKLSANESSFLISKQSDLNFSSSKAIDTACEVKNKNVASGERNGELQNIVPVQTNDLNNSELEGRKAEGNVNTSEPTKVSVMGRILGAISKDTVTSPQCSNADEKLTKSSQFRKWFDDSVNKLDSKFNRMRRFSESFKDGKAEENYSNTTTMQYSTNSINRNIDRVHSVDASSKIVEPVELNAYNNKSISSDGVTSKKGVVTCDDPVNEEVFSSSSMQSGAGFSSSSSEVAKLDDLNMKMVEQPNKEIVSVFKPEEFKFSSVPENKTKSLRESSLNVKSNLTEEYTHKQKNTDKNSTKMNIEDENLVVCNSDLNSFDESSNLRASEGKIQNRKTYTSVAEKELIGIRKLDRVDDEDLYFEPFSIIDV